jgi:hypothetical protein
VMKDYRSSVLLHGDPQGASRYAKPSRRI